MASSQDFPPYPLFCVPTEARQKIAHVFDTPSVTNITMEYLADTINRLCGYQLGFDGIVLQYLRSNQNIGPTMAMLQEAQKKNVNTQILQQAILELGENAANTVLPSYLPEIERIYRAHLANMAQTGNPRNSTCNCPQCISQMNFPHGYYPQNSSIDSNHNHTLTPQSTQQNLNVPLNSDIGTIPRDNQRCINQHCAHNIRGSQGLTERRNIPVSATSNIDRQMSDDDNNRYVLRYPHGRNICAETLSDPLPLSTSSVSSAGARPRSSPTKPRRVSDSDHRVRDCIPYGCNCKLCEINRLQSDSDETELKTSTSAYTGSEFSDPVHHGCPLSSVIQGRGTSGEINDNANLTRERSNSDVSSRPPDAQGLGVKSRKSDSDIHHIPLQCTCTRISKTPCSAKRGTIFVSLADHSNTHIHEVLKLCNYLSDIGYDIRCDMMDKLFEIRNLNKHEWIDLWFKKANYVLFCISPTYQEFISVGSKKEMDERARAEPNNNRFHTRYIFDRARSEYINNASLNYRFLPVLFKNSGANKGHLPDFLHATFCFVYPDTVKTHSLQNFLLNHKC